MLNRYFAHVKRGADEVKVFLRAESLSAANRAVLEAEKCPESAILWLGRVPRKKGRRGQSLLPR